MSGFELNVDFGHSVRNSIRSGLQFAVNPMSNDQSPALVAWSRAFDRDSGT